MPAEPSTVVWRCLRSIWASCRFEARRSLSVPRLTTWAFLVFFPVGIVGVFRYVGETLPTEAWAILFFLLIPEALCLLALLLWVAPMLQSELDGKTWPYLAVRPHGRRIVYFGKYLNGVAWTVAAGWTSLTLAVLVASPLMVDPWRLWYSIAILVLLSGVGYGAMYSLLAVLVPKRAILIAVGYTLIGELIVGMLPAVVCEATLQFHLRCLLKDLVGLKFNSQDSRLLFDSAPAWQHLAVWAGMAALFLTIGTWIVQTREYSIQDEA